jgi:hypothetical protein
VPLRERRKWYEAGCSVGSTSWPDRRRTDARERYEPVAGPVFHSTRYGGITMAGRHRLRNRVVQRTARHRAVEVVDARTLTAHFLTLDALAAGRLPKSQYIALCGQEVLPASLAEPGRNRCQLCVSIPSQRTRSS